MAQHGGCVSYAHSPARILSRSRSVISRVHALSLFQRPAATSWGNAAWRRAAKTLLLRLSVVRACAAVSLFALPCVCMYACARERQREKEGRERKTERERRREREGESEQEREREQEGEGEGERARASEGREGKKGVGRDRSHARERES